MTDLRRLLIELLDNHFAGNMIQLDRLMELLRKDFAYGGRKQKVIATLETIRDVKVLKQREPFSRNSIEFVCDRRAVRRSSGTSTIMGPHHR